jgi:glucokinase
MSSTRRRLVGGLDLGGTKIQAVVLDGRRHVVAEAKRPTPARGGGKGVVEALAATLAEACAGVSGARNLPGGGAPIRMTAGLKKLAGTPAYIDNDVTVGVHAEYVLGAAQSAKSLLGVWWGTGVGGGVILDGKKWEGRGAAGELGHVVVKVGGARCTCGRFGCLEAYAGRGAMELRARHLHKRGHKTDLFKIMEKRGRTRLQSGIWARALDHEDRMAVELIDRAIEAMGAGIASAVNLLDVSSVVIGGGLGTRLGDPYVKRIREAMQPHLFVDDNPPEVALAALGDLGGAMGAALLVPSGRPKRTTKR